MLHGIVSLLMVLSAGGAQRAGQYRIRGGASVCQRADCHGERDAGQGQAVPAGTAGNLAPTT
jgi:hypothetical protein